MPPRSLPFPAPSWPRGMLTPADEARFHRYDAATAFYRGDQRRAGDRHPPTLTVNYARALIRKTASYLFNDTVGYSVRPIDDPDAAGAAESALTTWRDALGLTSIDLSLAIDALVLGDAAMKVTWDAAAGLPRVSPVNPRCLLVETAADDPRRAETVHHAYAMTPAEARRRFDVEIGTGVQTDRPGSAIETWTGNAWRVELDGQPIVEQANPYGFIPYLIVANDAPAHGIWGVSDLDDVTAVCTELNERMSILARILELSGSPITVLEGVDGAEGIRIGPGARWELPEGARAYLVDLLQGGGAEVHLRYIDTLFRMLYDVSETPRTAFGDSGRDLSGAALEVEIQPLVQKIQRKRRGWDAVLSRRAAMMLQLAEQHGALDLAPVGTIAPIWPPILPSDTDSAVRNAVALVQTGIQSRRGAMAALGENDPEAEIARVREDTLDPAWVRRLP